MDKEIKKAKKCKENIISLVYSTHSGSLYLVEPTNQTVIDLSIRKSVYNVFSFFCTLVFSLLLRSSEK